MAHDGGLSHAIAVGVYKHRYMVVLGWAVLALALTPPAVILITQRLVGIQKNPVAGSESEAALDSLKRNFGTLADVRKEMVEIRCKTHCNIAASKRAKRYVEMIDLEIEKFDREHPGSIIHSLSYFDFHIGDKAAITAAGVDNPMISSDKQSVLLMWLWSIPKELQTKAEAFCVHLAEFIEEEINAKEKEDGLVVRLTGLVTLDRQMMVSIFEFVLHDVKNCWINILILGLALGDARLLFLALLPMPIEIITGWGLLYFVSQWVDVTYFSALICLQLITAMGWDYSLFTLTRYASERKNGLSVQEALVTAVSHSAPLIATSAVVLTISWSVLWFMPDMFKCFSAAAAIGVLSVALAQVTLVPAILAILPILGPEAGRPDVRAVSSGRERDQELLPLNESSEAAGDDSSELDPFTRSKQFMSGPYFNLAKHLTKWPTNIIVIVTVYLAMAPFTLRFLQNFQFPATFTGMSHSYALNIPRGREEWTTALRIQKNFDPKMGVLMPVTIFATNEQPGVSTTTTTTTTAHGLARWIPWRKRAEEYAAAAAEREHSLASQEFFDSNCRMMNAIITQTQDTPYAISAEDFASPAFPIPDQTTDSLTCEPFWRMNAILKGNAGNLLKRFAITKSIQDKVEFLWDLMVRDHAVLSVVNPAIDPFGPKSFELMKDIRRVLKETEDQDRATIPGLSLQVYGPATLMMDFISFSEKQLPRCFIACSLICFTLIALSFRAAFVPAKLILTVLVPISWCFGFALMVYEDGVLVPLGIPGLMPTGDAGLDWTVPMFSLTFMVGLALDYDYFLFERVYEFRTLAFGDREAIQLGVSATAKTITAGGMILASTFMSQIAGSTMPTCNQLGLVYVSGILIDTFIVRTIVVPALLSIGPWVNYYPVRMPEPRYQWLEAGLDPLVDNINGDCLTDGLE
eukprot:TRINITY_DN45395_c0_g1_i1.p1 TRINITY_DN45395_c0_g1~~TRINITY_DN45395_c0_g1_i1.p1  ORF type:complete len:931 (-),score=152.24 TRINITY_DN45395_c0_g1_i1:40-2793(-)